MLVSLWWLAKSGCQYQLSPGFANWVTLNSWEILGRQGVPVAAGCSESPVNVNIYSTNCVTWFESWRVSGWWWLRVVVWVWGSEWGRASGGRPESVRVSVSGQEAVRRGGGTVHSTPVQCCSTELSTWAKSGQRSSLKLSCDRNINTEGLRLLLSLRFKARKCDVVMGRCCAEYENQICVSSALPALILKNISEFSHA